MDDNPQWSTVPQPILAMISRRLETRIDVLRFRSICRSWRRSTTPLLSPLKLPFPICAPAGESRRGSFTAAQTTTFLLHPLDEMPDRSFSYLIKVEDSDDGKMRLVCPFSDQVVTHLPEKFPKVLDLSEFRVSELHKSYTFRKLEIVNHKPIEAGLPFVKKLIVLDSNPQNTLVVVVVYEMCDLDGRLAVLRVGDEKWTPIQRLQLGCADSIVYKGKFYMVNRAGRAFVLDPNMRLVETALPPTPPNENGKKHLVESMGDLLMVDKYFKFDERRFYYYRHGEEPVKSSDCKMVGDIKVYKLDEDEHRWVEVRSLEDRILLVGDDCSFFVSAWELPGCRGNRVLYEDHAVASQIEDEDEVFNGLWAHQMGVFNLGNGRVRSLATCPRLARIFWPICVSNPRENEGKRESCSMERCLEQTKEVVEELESDLTKTNRVEEKGQIGGQVMEEPSKITTRGHEQSDLVVMANGIPTALLVKGAENAELEAKTERDTTLDNSTTSSFGATTSAMANTGSSTVEFGASASTPFGTSAESLLRNQASSSSGTGLGSTAPSSGFGFGFGSSTAPSSGFAFGFGSSTAPSAPNLFQFGSQQNETPLPQQNPSPFQTSCGLDFSSGGSFPLPSHQGEKSSRKTMKVRKGPKP